MRLGASTNQVGEAKRQVATVEMPAAELAAKSVFNESTLLDMRKVSWSNLKRQSGCLTSQ